MLFKIDIPGVIEPITPDQLQFLTLMKSKVLENLSDPFFGVPELAFQMDISLPQLSRKLKAVSSYSPARMIRHFRMEYAMVLLTETRIPIKEVAHKTGFLEQGNFCRAFKRQFQNNPSDLRVRKRNATLSFDFYCQTPMIPEDLKYIEWLIEQRPWFNEVMETIIRNLDNEKFNSSQLASLLTISNSQLNKNLNDMLKVSATRLIKNVRLQYAAELLIYNKESVTDIAYEVGFFDLPHFSRTFKSAYQLTPKAYRENQKNRDVPRFVKGLFKLYKIDK